MSNYKFENPELKKSVDQVAQSIQAEAEYQSRNEELDALADLINNKLRWAKAKKPNHFKHEALAAIEALKQGHNVQANTEKLRAALSIIKAAEMQSLTAAIFHTQNQLAVEQNPTNKMAQSLLKLTKAIYDFKEATLTQSSLGLGLMINTFTAFKNNLGALDEQNHKTWAPHVTDDESLKIAHNYLNFLLFTSKHIQHLPMEQEAPSFAFNFIANALNFEGHNKPYAQYDEQKLTNNSVIDNTRKRIENFQGEDVDLSFIDGESAIVEYALTFVQTCDQNQKEDHANVILDIAKKVVALSRFDQYFGQSLGENKEHLITQTETLEKARHELQQFNAAKHEYFSDVKGNNEQLVAKIKAVLLEFAADNEMLKKEIAIVCKNMLVTNGVLVNNTDSRQVAYDQLQKIIAGLVKNNAETLHDLIGDTNQSELVVVEKKSLWQRIKSWFKKAFTKRQQPKQTNYNVTAEPKIEFLGLGPEDSSNNNTRIYQLLTEGKSQPIKQQVDQAISTNIVREKASTENLAGHAVRMKALSATSAGRQSQQVVADSKQHSAREVTRS